LKCLGEIWGTWQKFRATRRVKGCLRGLTRVLTKPIPLVDQGVLLGIVGDVFEVMAQVDRRLTKVNTIDLLIGVDTPAENLGRHRMTPLGLMIYCIIMCVPRGMQRSSCVACGRYGCCEIKGLPSNPESSRMGSGHCNISMPYHA
jgi:hypothetical protein